MSAAPASFHFSRRQLVLLGLVVIGLYVLVPQLGSFHSSWHLLRHPNLSWLVAAVILTALTYLAAALTYVLLAFQPLKYDEVVLAQLAVMFINRLLPGGIGALGANYAYLRRRKHTGAQAATMVAVNNILGLLGHILLVVVTLLLAGGSAKLSGWSQSDVGLIGKTTAALVIIVVVALLVARQRVRRFAVAWRQQMITYRQRPGHLLAALGSSELLTLCNVLCLYCCAHALGLQLSFAPILLIFTFGIGAGTATPTPGGLGGFEAGLVGGLLAYHIPSATALAVALLYRLVSYWLALAAGGIAFVAAGRQQLFL